MDPVITLECRPTCRVLACPEGMLSPDKILVLQSLKMLHNIDTGVGG